jgi:hypothetical protein
MLWCIHYMQKLSNHQKPSCIISLMNFPWIKSLLLSNCTKCYHYLNHDLLVTSTSCKKNLIDFLTSTRSRLRDVKTYFFHLLKIGCFCSFYLTLSGNFSINHSLLFLLAFINWLTLVSSCFSLMSEILNIIFPPSSHIFETTYCIVIKFVITALISFGIFFLSLNV